MKGSKLSNLRLADDVTVIAENLQELELCLKKLSAASKQKGIKINMSKTKVLRNEQIEQGQLLSKEGWESTELHLSGKKE